RVRCRDHPNRRAFGKGSERIECADPGADIGAAGDHGLLGFAGALGIENLQHEPVLLEEAGILPQLRKGILPRPCQSPGNAAFVPARGGANQIDKQPECPPSQAWAKARQFPRPPPEAPRQSDQLNRPESTPPWPAWLPLAGSRKYLAAGDAGDWVPRN